MTFVSKQRVLRWFIYFRRGHGTYLVFLLSFANFIVIQYRLLIQYIPVFELLFSSLLSFTIAFFLCYVPLAVVVGWLDTKRGSVPIAGAIDASVNPWNKSIAKALFSLPSGRVTVMPGIALKVTMPFSSVMFQLTGVSSGMRSVTL